MQQTLRVSLTLPLGPSGRQTSVTMEVTRDTCSEPADYTTDLISGDIGEWENYGDAEDACLDEAKRIWASHRYEGWPAQGSALETPNRAGLKMSPAEIQLQIADTRSEPAAMEVLNDWVLRDPSFRVVARMARIDSRCIVVLRGKLGTYTSETQLTFDSAVRAALMVALMEGDK